MMDIRIYQVNADRDVNGVMFTDFDQLQAWQGSPQVDASIYDLVYEDEIDGMNLEDVYRKFNYDYVEGYRGRSLSVSDVIEIREGGEEERGFYYCDRFGFKSVDFDSELTGKTEQQPITVVMVEPGKKASVKEIGTEFDDLQKAVGGFIETYYPFPDEGYKAGCCIVCNDEGKFNGMMPNRAVYDENHEIMDVIFGPFFICDGSGENIGSLSEEQQEGLLKEFGNPERFYSQDGKITAVPFEPVPMRAGHAR